MAQKGKHTLKSAEKLFTILELVIDQNGARVTDIADEMSLHKSTVHVHLQTLVKRGYLIHNNHYYLPSLKFLQNGEQIRENMEIYQKGRSEVNKLAQTTGELANLGVEENGEIILVHLLEGENAVHDHSPGRSIPIHCSAIGKSILAHLPRSAVEEIISEHGLPAVTEHTITDKDELFQELEQIRSQGFATDIEEGGLGICCIAAPITADGKPLGGVSVTGPAKRIGGEHKESLKQSVMNTANVIEVKINYTGQ